MSPVLLRPKSVGTVTLKSKNPFDPPVLDPNCLSHPDDVELMVKGEPPNNYFSHPKFTFKIELAKIHIN
jgi:choline dehydrogenase-like flavoprotein